MSGIRQVCDLPDREVQNQPSPDERMCEGACGGFDPEAMLTSTPATTKTDDSNRRRERDSGYQTDSPSVKAKFTFGDYSISHLEEDGATGGVDVETSTSHVEDFDLNEEDVFDTFKSNDELDADDEDSDDDEHDDRCLEDSDVFSHHNVSPPCSIPRANDHSPQRSVSFSGMSGMPLLVYGTPPRLAGPNCLYRYPGVSLASLRLQDSPSRTASTQTPSAPSQIIQQAIDAGGQGTSPVLQRFLTRGRAPDRFRSHSTGESDQDTLSGQNLPDLVPKRPMRDRSSSEPSVHRSLERYFGGELRRISDEFHQSYENLNSPAPPDGRNRNDMPHSASFPAAMPPSQRWWQKIMQYLPLVHRSPPNTSPREPGPRHPQLEASPWRHYHQPARNLPHPLIEEDEVLRQVPENDAEVRNIPKSRMRLFVDQPRDFDDVDSQDSHR